MTVYYNENDKKAAAWLRCLIEHGHIAKGEVDERSIEDVRPSDLNGYTQCHFFAGIGGWSHALRLAGWPDSKHVWTGSCPCQPFSAAGKGEGFTDERHLWPAFHHLIKERRPDIIFGEQVASKDGLAWIDLVQDDLEGEGYACGAVDTCAAGFGAPFISQRLYWVAEANGEGLEGHGGFVEEYDAEGWKEPIGLRPEDCDDLQSGMVNGFWGECVWYDFEDGRKRPAESGIVPMVNGVSSRVGRLRGYGNAIVTDQAKGFIASYLSREKLAQNANNSL